MPCRDTKPPTWVCQVSNSEDPLCRRCAGWPPPHEALASAAVPATTPRLEDTLIRGYRQLAQASPKRNRDVVLRALDIGFASVFLLVSLPLFFVIAVANLATGGRPVLYGGERVGRGGRVFRMFKFRTLTADAET